MDWYSGNGVDDLVVPSDQEPLDRLPSPNSWSRWGVSAPESFKSMTKYFYTQTNSLGKEPYFNGKSVHEEVDMDLSAQEHSNNSSVYQGYQEGSLQQTTSPCESSDYQLNDLSGTNQTDDIFMSSLLEDDPEDVDNVHGSFNFFPDFEYGGVLPADDLLMDMIIESEYDPRHFYGMGSSKHLKTNAFSPSTDWGHGEVSTLHTPCNLKLKDNPPIKTLVAKFASSSESDIMEGHVNEETALELSVLHELERVMTQMTEKTRICFRDALYRLAENSQHMADNGQTRDLIPGKPPPLIDHDDTLRSEITKTRESETNAIDRAVANLMFSKMDTGACDLAVAEPLNVKQEANVTTEQCNYSSSESQPPHWPHLTSLAGDAEVPIFI